MCEKIKLKLCPFCGGEAKLTEYQCGNSSNMWGRVECLECCTHIEESECLHQMKRDGNENLHKQRAVIVWNTRHYQPGITK